MIKYRSISKLGKDDIFWIVDYSTNRFEINNISFDNYQDSLYPRIEQNKKLSEMFGELL